MSDNDSRKIFDLSVNEFFNMLEERLNPIKDDIKKIANSSNDLLSYEEAAIYASTNRQKIHKLVREKKLKPRKIIGHKQKYFRRCDLDDLLQKCML